MTWRDAFKKAVAATGWMLIFIIIFGAIVGIGVVLGALNPSSAVSPLEII